MNKVMLIGNVGKEPDVKYYDADQAVAQFPLATTERGYVLPNGTRVPDRTDWHNIVMWRELAKIAERYVHKGDKIYIENTLQILRRQERSTQIYSRDICRQYGTSHTKTSLNRGPKLTAERQYSY